MNTSHERISTGKDEWLTPPRIIECLGPFDLDPCAPVNRPWPTAQNHYTIQDDGLRQRWDGYVWCNPPYGKETGIWLRKCAEHGNAIALTFARTETKAFFQWVWYAADAILFIKGRLKFHHVDGKESGTAGAPSVLIAYGEQAAEKLKLSGIEGRFLRLWDYV